MRFHHLQWFLILATLGLHAVARVIEVKTLTPRFWDDDYASAEDWERYSSKGGTMMCALVGSDRTAGSLLGDARNPPSAESVWQGDLVNAMNQWNWHEISDSQTNCNIETRWEFPEMLTRLRLDGRSKSSGGQNECFTVQHQDGNTPVINQFYQAEGKQYRATGAHYSFGINKRDGAIYNFYVTSAPSAAKSNWYGEKRDAAKDDLPKLRALSDILWGYWLQNNLNVRNIKYFFMVGISNDMTNKIMASALKNAGKQLSEWPGTKFPTHTDEGKALLGSPNGAAFAYFLMQHKRVLGPKTITDVTIFRPENDDDNDFVDASLVFYVADAPTPPPDS
ncbi:hypothetical protein M011DRAFT_397773 [Sporormia fimetaria CBS 119925]|uniref:Uncharacterized protein n=1 Tax=Sporormia fimetaria CBS 119925 TaxID=1340428 RepID=A0A6A6VJK4_9PLEO|nr:hypothetical protein M011DRAFT_397773 [Sporormia fimetaria CBS 119925]